ncbi:uncharacterized protein [Ptychodera flava]|uniref:uncharacterized protein n=1 Tax=Ptychodera flava TaxID=63121 RepID=UPI00396A4725
MSGYTVSPQKGKTFSEKQISKLKEVFSLFDKDDDGAITVRELETLLRIMGPLITEHEIREIVRNRKDAVFVETDNVDFPEFLTIMATRMIDGEDDSKETIRAFRIFEKDSEGFVKTSEMRQLLTQVGEQLTDEEMDEIISDLDTDNDGLIKYDELVRSLMAP